MIFDSLIFKEDDSFYIDVSDVSDISIEINDHIRFTHEGKKYLGKVKAGKYSFDKIYSIEILK